MTGGIRCGDVVRYTSERENRWCREGIAIAEVQDGALRLIDTYWETRDASVTHVLTDTEVATAEHMFNLHDFRTVREHEWRTYAPSDRNLVTAQHGLVRHFYVRTGAVPDLETQIGNARNDLEMARYDLARAMSRVEQAERELAELEARKPTAATS